MMLKLARKVTVEARQITSAATVIISDVATADSAKNSEDEMVATGVTTTAQADQEASPDSLAQAAANPSGGDATDKLNALWGHMKKDLLDISQALADGVEQFDKGADSASKLTQLSDDASKVVRESDDLVKNAQKAIEDLQADDSSLVETRQSGSPLLRRENGARRS